MNISALLVGLINHDIPATLSWLQTNGGFSQRRTTLKSFGGCPVVIWHYRPSIICGANRPAA